MTAVSVSVQSHYSYAVFLQIFFNVSDIQLSGVLKMMIKKAVSLSYWRLPWQVTWLTTPVMYSIFDPGNGIRQYVFCDHTISFQRASTPSSSLPAMLLTSLHTSPQLNKVLYCTAMRVYPSHSLWGGIICTVCKTCLNTTPRSPWGFGPCSLMLMIYFSIWSYSVYLPRGAMLQWSPAHSPSASAAATILHCMLLGRI